MTKAEAFDKAWRIAIDKDFSLVDIIYHEDYRPFDAYAEVEVNLEAEKSGIETFGEFLIDTNSTVLLENDNFLKVHRIQQPCRRRSLCFCNDLYYLQRRSNYHSTILS